MVLVYGGLAIVQAPFLPLECRAPASTPPKQFSWDSLSASRKDSELPALYSDVCIRTFLILSLLSACALSPSSSLPPSGVRHPERSAWLMHNTAHHAGAAIALPLPPIRARLGAPRSPSS
ncbi:hypothetical protein HGRIS_014631 [Hohenbuehelia grisea]|uniref:Uncharacterized protein n=1 Tax=Hohenbuehelia grisea TaxID=104357 RepID=A0ABR3JVU5_9AGAR